MSVNDIIKEQKEYETFLEAYSISQTDEQTHTITKQIMNSIFGERVNRQKNDSPDLIFEVINQSGSNYVGVEIFSVDQNSLPKGKSYQSESKKNIAMLDKIANDMYEDLKTTGNISQALFDKNKKVIFDYARGQVNSGYKSFIDAFRYHFCNHAKNILKYRSNIKSETNHEVVKLAFFIEIEAEVTDWFVNPVNNGCIEKINNMPFFREMISVVNSSDNMSLLDYLVFYIHDPLKNNKQVVAIENIEIMKQLEKQNITVYHFVGEEDALEKINGTSSSWSINSNPDKSISNDIFPIYLKAVKLKKENQPFVASRYVQHLLYICPHARNRDEFDFYLFYLGKDKVHKLSKEFSALYSDKKF